MNKYDYKLEQVLAQDYDEIFKLKQLSLSLNFLKVQQCFFAFTIFQGREELPR